MIKVKYVEQIHEYGCAVACIAMVLGKTYEEIDRQFEAPFDRKGMNPEHARDFICDHEFSVIECRSSGYYDVRLSNERMAQPFAHVHVLQVMPRIDSKFAHSLVMDAKGRIFDPARGPKPQDFRDYYVINRVLGFFRDGQGRK